MASSTDAPRRVEVATRGACSPGMDAYADGSLGGHDVIVAHPRSERRGSILSNSEVETARAALVLALTAATDYDPSRHSVPSVPDALYSVRNAAVVVAARAAVGAGLKVWWSPDQDGDDEWFIQFIELPAGQISWHLPADLERVGQAGGDPWDGHSVEEKVNRVISYVWG